MRFRAVFQTGQVEGEPEPMLETLEFDADSMEEARAWAQEKIEQADQIWMALFGLMAARRGIQLEGGKLISLTEIDDDDEWAEFVH